MKIQDVAESICAYYFSLFCIISWFSLCLILGIVTLIDKIKQKFRG